MGSEVERQGRELEHQFTMAEHALQFPRPLSILDDTAEDESDDRTQGKK